MGRSGRDTRQRKAVSAPGNLPGRVQEIAAAVRAVSEPVESSVSDFEVRVARQPGELVGSAASVIRERVADLVNASLPAGQPRCTADDVAEAFRGTSPVDDWCWQEIKELHHVFILDEEGTLVGAAAVGDRGTSVVIPWLEAAENPRVIQELLRAADLLRDRRPAAAFEFASALTLGMEGLPVRHRPQTHAAFISNGFQAKDMWAYFERDGIDGDWSGQDVAQLEPGDGAEANLKTADRETGKQLAEATVEVAPDGTGILWWVFVEPEARGSGLGRRIFRQAIREMIARGAKRLVLYVDDDDPVERNRDRAKKIYRDAGFVERDRLFSYEKS